MLSGTGESLPMARRDSSFSNGSTSHHPFTRHFGSTSESFDLAPPSLPFADNDRSSIRSSSDDQKSKNLSVNYVPNKFSRVHGTGDWQQRQAKRGGGREAFADDAGRMGGGDIDFVVGKGKKKAKLRWNRFKWALFVTNLVIMVYSLAALVLSFLVWFDIFYQADVVRVGNRVELIISTLAAAFGVLTALIGFAGILLNNRAFLAVYNFFLWICLALIVTPGYLTYKQRTFNLEGKINSQWSRDLGLKGRLRIQNSLACCGYFSPYVGATASNLCYARSNLPGCKGRYLRFERNVLGIWYTVSFSLVPIQIFIIITALLSSQHITYRFGKGLTPKRYRLDVNAMTLIMDEYASQIAGVYGSQVAKDAMSNRHGSTTFSEKPQVAHSTGLESNQRATHRNAGGFIAARHRPSYEGSYTHSMSEESAEVDHVQTEWTAR